MGMFDFVRVEGHEVPGVSPGVLRDGQGPVRKILEMDGTPVYEDGDLHGSRALFQTKDLDNAMNTYVIRGGRLFERYARRQDDTDIDTDYHGDLSFCTLKSDVGEPGRGIVEFVARFSEGDLQWIRRVEERD